MRTVQAGTLFLGLLVTVAAVALSGVPAEALELKLGHVVAENTAIDVGAHYFAKLVEEKSGGEITIRVFPNSQLGGNREMLEGLQLGIVDFVPPTAAWLAGFTSKAFLFDLPFLFKNNAHAEAVLDGPIGQEILEAMEEHGFVGLAWWTQSWRHLTTRNRRVTQPSDVRGLKIRVQDNPLHIEAWNALGASAVPMAFSEVFTALQQRVIDGQENPYANIKLSGFYQAQDYIIETGHIYDAVSVLASRITWDRLTEEQRRIIKEAAQEARIFQRQFAAQQDAEIRAEMLESGITVVELTEEQRMQFQEASQAVYESWGDRIGWDLIRRVHDEGARF